MELPATAAEVYGLWITGVDATGSGDNTARGYAKSPTAELTVRLELEPIGTAGFDRQAPSQRRAANARTHHHDKAPAVGGGRVGTAGFEPATP
jgi:hypothetical protein